MSPAAEGGDKAEFPDLNAEALADFSRAIAASKTLRKAAKDRLTAVLAEGIPEDGARIASALHEAGDAPH
jgi:hypothetical protein